MKDKMTLFNKLKKYTAFWFVVIILGICSFAGLMYIVTEYRIIGIWFFSTLFGTIAVWSLWLVAKEIAEHYRK